MTTEFRNTTTRQVTRSLKPRSRFNQYPTLCQLIDQGKTQEVFQLYNDEMKNFDGQAYAVIIEMCRNLKLKDKGDQLVQDALNAGHGKNSYVVNTIINFLVETEIDRIPQLYQMVRPNEHVFSNLMQICAIHKLKEFGLLVYQDAVDTGFGYNGKVLNASSHFFVKVGMLSDAEQCYARLMKINPSSKLYHYWLQCLIDLKRIKDVIQQYRSMTQYHTNRTYPMLLSLCSKHQLKELGQEVYQMAINTGCGDDVHLLTVSISFFGNFGMLDQARQCFNQALKVGANSVTYNAWLQCLINSRKIEEAIQLYESMTDYRDRYTYSIALSMCYEHKLKIIGQDIYHSAIKSGFGDDLHVVTASISFFGDIGMLDQARQCFNQALKIGANYITHTAWLRCLVNAGQIEEATQLYRSLPKTKLTFAIMLGMCGKHQLKEFGQEIYQSAINAGFGDHKQVLSASILFFANVGMLNDAEQRYKRSLQIHGLSSGAYNVWLKCLVEANKVEDAIQLFRSSNNLVDEQNELLLLSMCSKHQLKEFEQEILQRRTKK